MSRPIHHNICQILNIVSYLPFKYNNSKGIYVKSKGLRIYTVTFSIFLNVIYLLSTLIWMTNSMMYTFYLVDIIFILIYYGHFFLQMVIFTYYNAFRGNELMEILNSIHVCYQKFCKRNTRSKLWHDYLCVFCELILNPISIISLTFLCYGEVHMNLVTIFNIISTVIYTWTMGILLPFYLYMQFIIELLNKINISLEKQIISRNSEFDEKFEEINSITEIYTKIHTHFSNLTQFYSLIICSILFNILLSRIWQTYRLIIFFDDRNTNHDAEKIFYVNLEFLLMTAAFLKTLFYLLHSANLIYNKSEKTKLILHELIIFHNGVEDPDIIKSVSFRNC